MQKRKKSVSQKNIYKTVHNGLERYVVQIIEKGTRKRKFFSSLALAQGYLRTHKEAKTAGISDVAEMSVAQLSDIRHALKLLPPALTLVDCVKTAISLLVPEKAVSDVLEEFADLKNGNVSHHYYITTKTRLGKFGDAFKSFDQATPAAVMKFCKDASASAKTQRHYITLLKEFFDYAVRKDYWRLNPFDKIHNSEIPKIVRKPFTILSVKDAQTLFKRLEKDASSIAGLYALVAFGGFRLAEARRLIPEYFNFKTKEILLPFSITKTGDTWLQANMPDNVWAWLEKCPHNEKWEKRRDERILQDLNLELKFENNALRHSFATYHYSLHRNEYKTQDLMRHTTAAQLKQTYLAGLVSKEAAEAYFNILPKK